MKISQNRRFQDDGEFEEIVYKRDTPLIWRSLKEFNLTETEHCRNSEQGVFLLTDERGFICDRDDLLSTGCCNIKADNTHLYSCKSCNEHHCCEVFENCVSCCLDPDNVCWLYFTVTSGFLSAHRFFFIKTGPYVGKDYSASKRSAEASVFPVNRSFRVVFEHLSKVEPKTYHI